MKRIYLILLPVLLFTPLLQAQHTVGPVVITGHSVSATEGEVSLSFSVKSSSGALKKGEIATLVPVITDGEYKVSFTPLVLLSEKTKKHLRRHEFAAGVRADYTNAVIADESDTIHYNASVPVQLWMQEGMLTIEALVSGCCHSERMEFTLQQETIPIPLRIGEPVVTIVEYEVETTPPFMPVSIADTLALDHTFLIPVEEYNEGEPYRVYEDERKSSLALYFKSGSLGIDPEYMNNRHTMNNLLATIHLIRSSSGSEVRHIVVAGFSSPEGSFKTNDRLAWERAVAIKKYIMETTDTPSAVIHIYNGSADWKGLRMLVDESDMYGKQAVLDIIDHTPIQDTKRGTGRLDELKKLDGGEPYRYMLKEFFPKLRNGAFIKVYYENKQVDEK